MDSCEDEEYYSDYMTDDDTEIALASINKSKRINLSIRADYTNWEAREAFRELVQNWRDAIIASFKLKEHEFTVIRESRKFGRGDSSEEILYKVPDPRPTKTGESLGYILFTGRNGFGQIAITNRSAALEPGHLDLGRTTKKRADNQAGAHGEGLKLALLVLMRSPQNHAVRCLSGDFSWRFNFTKLGRLVAGLTRMSVIACGKALNKATQQSAGSSLVPFAASPGKDVQFFIGEKRRGRNERGHEISHSQVARAEFEAWVKSALFLYAAQDDSIIKTPRGDLLTSPELVGCLYLKGLLLSETTATQSASITNRPLKFGYNFAHGQTNRERQSIVGPLAEGTAITAIWKGVMAERPDMINEYSDMLNSDEPMYADMYSARFNLQSDKATATLLRNHLLGGGPPIKWYHSADELRQNPRLDDTIRGLGCEAVQLTEDYWFILTRHGLLRTAAKEEEKRFRASQSMSVPGTSFAASVCRILKTCMRHCQKTTNISITFVQAGQLQLPLHYSPDDGILLIHDRWLDAAKAADSLGLPDTLAENDQVYHTVERLFADALAQLPDTDFLEEGLRKTAKWRRDQEICIMTQNLLNYFRTRIVVWDDSGFPRALRVTWSFDECWAATEPILVQCHRMSACSRLWQKIVNGDEIGDLRGVQSCAAPENHCRGWQGKVHDVSHVEFDLDPDEEYFFVVLRLHDTGAFPVVSETKSVSREPLANTTATSTTPRAAQSGSSRVSVASPSGIDSSRSSTSSTTSSMHSSSFPSMTFDLCGGSSNSDDDDVDSSTSPASAHVSNRLATNGTSRAVQPRTPVSTPSRRIPAIKPASSTESQASDPTSFVLGARLHTIDILKIDQEQCYEGKGSDGRQAIVAMIKGASAMPYETRKRRRVDGVE